MLPSRTIWAQSNKALINTPLHNEPLSSVLRLNNNIHYWLPPVPWQQKREQIILSCSYIFRIILFPTVKESNSTFKNFQKLWALSLLLESADSLQHLIAEVTASFPARPASSWKQSFTKNSYNVTKFIQCENLQFNNNYKKTWSLFR